VGPLTADSAFTLNCSGPGGSTSQTRNVTVTPAAPPSVDLSADPDWVAHGTSTALAWNTTNADSCTASGAWSGSKNASGGTENVGPITEDSTYSISCSGSGGSAVSAVSVGVRSALLSWEAPKQNVDGSQLTDLTGFKVYYGQGSRNYSNVIPINDPATLELQIDLNPGTYYFTVTAVNAADEESAFSGEVSKTIE
jgi:hypothetical protein